MTDPTEQEIQAALAAGREIERIDKLAPTKQTLFEVLGSVVSFHHRETNELIYYLPYAERIPEAEQTEADKKNHGWRRLEGEEDAGREWLYSYRCEDMPVSVQLERKNMFHELMEPVRAARIARGAELSANVDTVNMANGIQPPRTIPEWLEDHYGRKTGALNVRRWGRRQRVS